MQALRTRAFPILLLAALLAGEASAVSGAYLGEKGFDEQVQNAAEAAESALAGAATNGETVRGASGAMAQIVTNSGSLICNAWIIDFEIRIRNMHLEAGKLDGDALNRQLDAIRKSEDFVARLEKACTDVGLVGQTPKPKGGQAVPPQGGATAPAPNDGTKVQPREGETLADEICRRKCASEYGAMLEAQRALEQAQKSARRAMEVADAARGEFTEAEQGLKDAQQKLEALKANRPTATGTPTAAQQEQFAQHHSQLSGTRARIEALEGELPRLRQEAAEKQQTAATLERAVTQREAELAQASETYNGCLRRCISAAQSAGEKTTLAVPPPNTSRLRELLQKQKSAAQSRMSGGGNCMGPQVGESAGSYAARCPGQPTGEDDAYEGFGTPTRPRSGTSPGSGAGTGGNERCGASGGRPR